MAVKVKRRKVIKGARKKATTPATSVLIAEPEGDSKMTKAVDWVKANPWKAAGIAVAVVVVLAVVF